jgi:hypothetical protein
MLSETALSKYFPLQGQQSLALNSPNIPVLGQNNVTEFAKMALTCLKLPLLSLL